MIDTINGTTTSAIIYDGRLGHFLEFVLLVNIAIFLRLCFTILCMFVKHK